VGIYNGMVMGKKWFQVKIAHLTRLDQSFFHYAGPESRGHKWCMCTSEDDLLYPAFSLSVCTKPSPYWPYLGFAGCFRRMLSHKPSFKKLLLVAWKHVDQERENKALSTYPLRPRILLLEAPITHVYQNSGPCACQICDLPLSYILNPGHWFYWQL
jgi:hypothetical protein